MITEIGITAGEIWHYLDELHKPVSFAKLASEINRPRDLLLMSLGWLAREGHALLIQEGDNYKVSLRR
jgi:hypothetical protein